MKLAAAIALCAASLTFGLFHDAGAAEKTAERRTPVLVEYEGSDTIGGTLFTRLQSRIASTNPASPARETKFRILLSTKSEFPSRPGVGSVYTAVWTLSMSEGSMEYYLVRDLGVVTPDTIDAVIEQIMGRTEGVAARYGYLDREK
ncbi:MAG: hypothetical protein MJ061_06825 [Mailhella sp.]|nr:hypothetical protein [Mailhella sp.]